MGRYVRTLYQNRQHGVATVAFNLSYIYPYNRVPQSWVSWMNPIFLTRNARYLEVFSLHPSVRFRF